MAFNGQTQAPDMGSLVELEVDMDRDSSLGDDDYESFTTSVASKTTDYKLEHGRRYHAFDDKKYPLPNDDAEINRLELQHRIWAASLNDRLFLAPLPAPSTNKILNAIDIGCGTGAWAIDFAELYPTAAVTGVDLSPIQPEAVPLNVTFLVDDVTHEWLYHQKFDYIHSRSISVGIRDWNALIDQVWSNLQPGGWVEFQEYHMPMACDDETMRDTAFEAWNARVVEASEKVGVKLDVILKDVPQLLQEKGFVSLGKAATKWPIGRWPKDPRQKNIGSMFLTDLLSGLEGISTRMFTKVLDWEQEAVLEYLKDVEAELKGNKIHAYMPIDLVWAQKPEDAVE